MRKIKRLAINVSQKWINYGIEGNSRRCMIKEAVHEAYPKLKNIRASRDYLRATDPERNVIYTFPMSATGRTMLLLFDEGNRAAIRPFTLHLSRPIIRKRVAKVHQGKKETTHRIKGREYSKVRSSQDNAKKHLGAVPARLEKDRVFGEKLWTAELRKLREDLGIQLVSPVGTSPA
jgi:hypothetical protein